MTNTFFWAKYRPQNKLVYRLRFIRVIKWGRDDGCQSLSQHGLLGNTINKRLKWFSPQGLALWCAVGAVTSPPPPPPLPGKPKLLWHPVRLIKDGGCVDLSMDTMHPKATLDLKALLLLSLFYLLQPKLKIVCHFFFDNGKGPLFGNMSWHLMVIVCQCAFKPSFIHLKWHWKLFFKSMQK